jgi:hypothetical protein
MKHINKSVTTIMNKINTHKLAIKRHSHYHWWIQDSARCTAASWYYLCLSDGCSPSFLGNLEKVRNQHYLNRVDLAKHYWKLLPPERNLAGLPENLQGGWWARM